MNNSNLNKKRVCPFKRIIWKKPRDVVLNRARDYYENDKKQARDKYRNLSQ